MVDIAKPHSSAAITTDNHPAAPTQRTHDLDRVRANDQLTTNGPAVEARQSMAARYLLAAMPVVARNPWLK